VGVDSDVSQALACPGCRDFGGQAMPAQQIIKAMATLFECKDDKARTRAKDIVVRCVGCSGMQRTGWQGPV
jgi:hypothetical protein